MMKLPITSCPQLWPLNHMKSFSGGMFKLKTKLDADSLLYLLSYFECNGHTVHMLTEQQILPPLTSTVKSSLFTHGHSSPLSLAARLQRCHANCSPYINNGWTFSRQTSQLSLRCCSDLGKILPWTHHSPFTLTIDLLFTQMMFIECTLELKQGKINYSGLNLCRFKAPFWLISVLSPDLTVTFLSSQLYNSFVFCAVPTRILGIYGTLTDTMICTHLLQSLSVYVFCFLSP